MNTVNNLIDKIVIDENRNIEIIFKYDVIPKINFMYENRNLVRNPYSRKGKKYDIITSKNVNLKGYIYESSK